MDDVKRLLEGFADRAVDGLPAADVEADVARGRRALRRIRTRRRVTGVLCAAVVTTAVLAIGNQVKWWGGGGTEVATGSDEAGASASASASTEAAGTATPATGADQAGESASVFAGAMIELTANSHAWSNIDCALAPQGWTPEAPVTTDRVVLTPPLVRTSSDSASELVLQAAPEARSLQAVRVTEADGKVFHVGTEAGRAAGQVKLGERWLLVQLPVGDKDWNDEILRRFMGSCKVS
ncbi:hypothetical protein [Kribbella sp. VKM Ac-2568]|uniref:hypothetical protein n=1 Tax=Kribbella sp. VKM Ac-2568 TaxID=2512219 RepID=UPI00104DC376|nr:hypothetical protein [Kribbella sp. VKM Ac-2568]TCM41208.1 hypothetical protein EV648_112265 [Kribbella sp. VKM Ac-2568]